MRSSRRNTAFTLIELLVVVGILALLIGILVPTVSRSLRKGREARIAADLQTIGVALDAYRADFGDYPRVTDVGTLTGPPTNLPYNDDHVLNGAKVLCRALVGLGDAIPTSNVQEAQSAYDGADGLGVRGRAGQQGPNGVWGGGDDLRPQGKVFGPYIQPEKFKFGNADDLTSMNKPLSRMAILDINGYPIFYMPAARRRPDISLVNAYVGPFEVSQYDLNDVCSGLLPTRSLVFRQNGEADDVNATRRVQAMLGDTNCNGAIVGPEIAATNAPYLLWSAGDDGFFGPLDITDGSTAVLLDKNRDVVLACDDVTNFNK